MKNSEKTITSALEELSALPPQVEFTEFKLEPRFSGEPNGASKLDWSVFTKAAPKKQEKEQSKRKKQTYE